MMGDNDAVGGIIARPSSTPAVRASRGTDLGIAHYAPVIHARVWPTEPLSPPLICRGG